MSRDTAVPNIAADLTIDAKITALRRRCTKSGAGTLLTLGGQNTYTGPTRITAGAVDIGSTAALGSLR